MTDDIRERVRRGAALLDKTRPGWAAKVEPDRLAMNSCIHCVLGQLYGDYDLGIAEILFEASDEEPSFIDAAEHGFTALNHLFLAGESADMASAWLAEISARLHPEFTEA